MYHIHVGLLLSVPLHGLLPSQKHLVSLCLFLALEKAQRHRACVGESTVVLGRELMRTPTGYGLSAISESREQIVSNAVKKKVSEQRQEIILTIGLKRRCITLPGLL